jgi:hypothetical protein
MTKRFTFWRNAIVAETYVVEAETEEEARDLVRDCNGPTSTTSDPVNKRRSGELYAGT